MDSLSTDWPPGISWKKQLHTAVLWGGFAAIHSWMWIAHIYHGEEEEEHERIRVEKIELECAPEWEISSLHYL